MSEPANVTRIGAAAGPVLDFAGRNRLGNWVEKARTQGERQRRLLHFVPDPNYPDRCFPVEHATAMCVFIIADGKKYQIAEPRLTQKYRYLEHWRFIPLTPEDESAAIQRAKENLEKMAPGLAAKVFNKF